MTSLKWHVICCIANPVANGALFVQRKLGFSVRVGYQSSVPATSFRDVIDFQCFERRQLPIGRYADTRFRLNAYGRRAFSVAGPMAWNSLLDFIRDPTSSTDCFRRLLKLKRTCSRVTSASSALAVLNDYALYKSTHARTHSHLLATPVFGASRCPGGHVSYSNDRQRRRDAR